MVICIDKNDLACRFFVDSKNRFTMIPPFGEESVLLTDVSEEYDGICSYDGVFHFLIQSLSGELIYLKCEKNVWKKFRIFKNKDNECRIKHIKLTFSENVLCAFYVIDHLGKNMLVKHMFSSKNLYITPEVADLTDYRKDFCICTDGNNSTHLFYRDESGKWQKIVYDKNFLKKNYEKCIFDGDIYNLSAVNNGKKTDIVYVTAKKNYTALMYHREDEREEKIITFGISKNTKPVIYSNGDEINILWQDSKSIFKVMSKDGGQTFSKPSPFMKKTEIARLRVCGLRTGINYSEWALMSDFESKNKPTIICERGKGMTSKFSDNFDERRTGEITYKLGEIGEEIKKIGFGLDRVCAFLERLTELKKESEKPIEINADIGEKNEENIKLFESLSIDEALPEKKETTMVFEE